MKILSNLPFIENEIIVFIDMEENTWTQPEESDTVKYIEVSDEEMKEIYDVAVKMIENGQTRFIDAKPLNPPDIT